MPQPAVAVIGGGVFGLTLALRLSQRGHRVTVFEAAQTPGGLAAPQQIAGYVWDRFYHVTLLSDRALLALLDELGLAERLRWRRTRTGFWIDGRMHELSSTLDFLRFPPLNLWDKARLAATILRASHQRDWEPLEGETALRWLKRWSGPRTVRRVWQPLLEAKLGRHYNEASATFIWAIIRRMYAARRSGLKHELFGHVDGGYAVVLARLADLLRARGVELRCGEPVREVREADTGAGAEVVTAGQPPRHFDHAVLTLPCGGIARICPQLTEPERARLAGVVYQGVICVSLLLRRPLGGFYVTNIADPAVPFTAVIEMTALVDRATFGGHTLVYLPRYATADDPAWGWDNAATLARMRAGLRRLYPDLLEDDMVGAAVGRAREVLALPTVRYAAERLPPLATSLPHVWIANSAQIVAGTLNVNETIQLVERQAPLLADAFAAIPTPELVA